MGSPPAKTLPLYREAAAAGGEEEEGEEAGEEEEEGEEEGEEAERSLVWDTGFGAYVPRPSVSQPKVYVRVVFLKIGEIDTLKELFRAEVFVQARWREPALDHCHHVSTDHHCHSVSVS